MKRGASAVSPNASRICRIQKFRPCSKSTNVSSHQMRSRISVARHDFSAAANQQFENPERLRRQLDAVTVSSQLAATGIKLEYVETKDRSQVHSSKTHVALMARPWIPGSQSL